MQRHASHVLACAALLVSTAAAVAQTDPAPAMNNPDMVAWQLFIQVNSRAGGTNAVFETFASDTDTFQPNPQYPTGPTPSAMHPPISGILCARRRAQERRAVARAAAQS